MAHPVPGGCQRRACTCGESNRSKGAGPRESFSPHQACLQEATVGFDEGKIGGGVLSGDEVAGAGISAGRPGGRKSWFLLTSGEGHGWGDIWALDSAALASELAVG